MVVPMENVLPPPAFDVVPGCPTCAGLLRIAGTAWKLGYTLYWLEYGSRGDKHLLREHLGDPGLDPEFAALARVHG